LHTAGIGKKWKKERREKKILETNDGKEIRMTMMFVGGVQKDEQNSASTC